MTDLQARETVPSPSHIRHTPHALRARVDVVVHDYHLPPGFEQQEHSVAANVAGTTRHQHPADRKSTC